MPSTQARYQAAAELAFREILSAWLATVPSAGWEGSIGELEDAFEDVKQERGLRGWIPRANALGVRFRNEMHFLEAQGYAGLIGRRS